MRPLSWDILDHRLILKGPSVRACVNCLDRCEAYPVPKGSLNIAFLDPATCRDLHKAFFGDPDPTDVMTFPADDEDDLAGDIAICPEVASREAPKHGLSFEHELTLYLVHAWLHLGGMEDTTSHGQAAMRTAEQVLMDVLRGDQALLSAVWRP